MTPDMSFYGKKETCHDPKNNEDHIGIYRYLFFLLMRLCGLSVAVWTRRSYFHCYCLSIFLSGSSDGCFSYVACFLLWQSSPLSYLAIHSVVCFCRFHSLLSMWLSSLDLQEKIFLCSLQYKCIMGTVFDILCVDSLAAQQDLNLYDAWVTIWLWKAC